MTSVCSHKKRKEFGEATAQTARHHKLQRSRDYLRQLSFPRSMCFINIGSRDVQFNLSRSFENIFSPPSKQIYIYIFSQICGKACISIKLLINQLPFSRIKKISLKPQFHQNSNIKDASRTFVLKFIKKIYEFNFKIDRIDFKRKILIIETHLPYK